MYVCNARIKEGASKWCWHVPRFPLICTKHSRSQLEKNRDIKSRIWQTKRNPNHVLSGGKVAQWRKSCMRTKCWCGMLVCVYVSLLLHIYIISLYNASNDWWVRAEVIVTQLTFPPVSLRCRKLAAECTRQLFGGLCHTKRQSINWVTGCIATSATPKPSILMEDDMRSVWVQGGGGGGWHAIRVSALRSYRWGSVRRLSLAIRYFRLDRFSVKRENALIASHNAAQEEMHTKCQWNTAADMHSTLRDLGNVNSAAPLKSTN